MADFVDGLGLGGSEKALEEKSMRLVWTGVERIECGVSRCEKVGRREN